MFSGIVEETGSIVGITHKKNLCVLDIQAQNAGKGTKQGDSVSVNGVCLTVTKVLKKVLSFDLMLETLEKTSLGQLSKGDKVNLERALKMSDRISGHFVTGHVDDMGTVKKIITDTNYTEIQISLKVNLMKYIVAKGSVSLDGVSLTIGDVRKRDFSVYLIPFTLEVTNLGLKQKGDKVNVETDILAKYILSKGIYSESPYAYKKE
ncbi:MAG: riboflavin synthase [Candidatus Omnitrophica bacterium]|nr:riboflavin synthase [Candidatus Omnitrophota bacterium]